MLMSSLYFFTMPITFVELLWNLVQEQFEMHKYQSAGKKIGQRVSAISIFPVVLFRTDQRLLITTAVPISILGMSSSSSLPCICCLWLYDNPQPERRGRPFQLSEADHLDAFAYLSEIKLLQGSVCCKLEQLTCLLYSSKEARVNDARLQTLSSKMPKKGPKMSQRVKIFDPASLPPW